MRGAASRTTPPLRPCHPCLPDPCSNVIPDPRGMTALAQDVRSYVTFWPSPWVYVHGVDRGASCTWWWVLQEAGKLGRRNAKLADFRAVEMSRRVDADCARVPWVRALRGGRGVVSSACMSKRGSGFCVWNYGCSFCVLRSAFPAAPPRGVLVSPSLVVYRRCRRRWPLASGPRAGLDGRVGGRVAARSRRTPVVGRARR